MGILFAQIDAKDIDVITIDGQCERSQHNVLVMTKARKTYMERLYKLQQSITKEFEPQLEDDSHIPDDKSYRYAETQKTTLHPPQPSPFRELANKMKISKDTHQVDFDALSSKCPHRCKVIGSRWGGCSKDIRTFNLTKCLIQHCSYLT